MLKVFLWFGITCMIAAGVLSIITHDSAQTANQTSSTNETNTLLKQMLEQQKLQIQRQGQQLQPFQAIPPIPTNPGCGIGTDNLLCNVPVPPSAGPVIGCGVGTDNSFCNLPPLPKGGLVPPPAAIAQMAKDFAYAHALLDRINKQMALEHNSSTANFIAHLRQLHAQGIIDCPHPGQAPFGHCIFAPPGQSISPLPIPPAFIIPEWPWWLFNPLN